MILVGIMTCGAIRRRHRQFALKCHYVLVALAIAAIEYHLFLQISPYRWVLLGAICLWCLCTLVVLMQAMVAHKPWKGSHCMAKMWPSGGVLWVEVRLPYHRDVRPGQFVQMWVPCAGCRVFTQLALLYVVVAEREKRTRESTIRMVARPQRGLTDILYRSSFTRPRSVAILGPYGRPHDFAPYGTIVFAVEDIGIFRALSYIGMLVEDSRKRQVMARKVEVVWQRDKAFGGSNPSKIGFSVYAESSRWLRKSRMVQNMEAGIDGS